VIVYHGTIYAIQAIDPKRFKKNKDFGLGFYITSDVEQAKRFAQRLMRLESAPSCMVYEIEVKDHPLLVTKNFHGLEEEWLDYVVTNRTGKQDYLTEDILIGPVADDSVGAIVSNYTANTYGEVGTKRAKQIALELLKLEVYTDQIVLKTNLAWQQAVIKGVAWRDQ
jgi:hypothetical protein